MRKLFNRFCDIWALPIVQVPVLVFFVLCALYNFQGGNRGEAIADTAFTALPVYFLVLRPLLKRRGLI